MSLVHWIADRPALRRPVLLVALEGFVDAGSVASTAATFLSTRWGLQDVARLDTDQLIDYRARRPTGVIDGGRVRRLEWQDLVLSAAGLEAAAHDVMLLSGPEPDMRWHAFAAEVADLALDLEIEQVVIVGAYPAATPHTRPVSIVQAGNSIGGEGATGVAPVQAYTGPAPVGVALLESLERVGIAGVSLWAEVPHYIANSPDPSATLAMVEQLTRIVGAVADTSELEASATVHRTQVDEAVADHEEAKGMVAALEEHVDSGAEELELPSGDALASEIERFLRTQQGG